MHKNRHQKKGKSSKITFYLQHVRYLYDCFEFEHEQIMSAANKQEKNALKITQKISIYVQKNTHTKVNKFNIKNQCSAVVPP